MIHDVRACRGLFTTYPVPGRMLFSCVPPTDQGTIESLLTPKGGVNVKDADHWGPLTLWELKAIV